MNRSYNLKDRIFNIMNTTFLLLLIAITLYPFLYVIAISFSSSSAIMANKVTIFPVKFTLAAYKMVVDTSEFWVSYKNTIIYAILGTLAQLIGTTMLAYPLSKKRLLFRSGISYMAAFTMYFGGGMVPYYLLINALHLRNTIWVMVIPGAVSVYNGILLRTYFQNNVPAELEESATIDGMGQWGILTKIYVPLSKPIYATLILFISVGIWNNYFGAMIFLDSKKLYPLQLYLRSLLMTGVVQELSGGAKIVEEDLVVGESLKGATIVVTMLPIMVVYPFIQRYFVKGILVGSIKG